MSGETGKQASLAEALAACDELATMTESLWDQALSRALQKIREVLRRQGMLLTLAALLIRQHPRDERKLANLVAECANETHRMTDAELLGGAEVVQEKAVPRPSAKPEEEVYG